MALQFVDGDGNICAPASGEGSLASLLGDDHAEDYGIVSIMGPQSSGKSTLMNKLFATPFAVMDASQGRSQTTLGVWASKAQELPLIVLDLQGTDSIEGGEESKTFERQSSLFALALCDVVVINVWFQDLGRYDAAGMSLLRTIFEVHLQLFASRRPDGAAAATTLLFLIRDHMEQVTPLAKLEQLVRRDIANVWAAVTKPCGMEAADVSAVFRVRISALPHYVYEPDKFTAAAAQLRARFAPAPAVAAEAAADELCAPLLCGHAAAVPLDGLADFAAGLWRTIRAEDDLDLPSQRRVLALHRCAQIGAAALRAFVGDTLSPLKEAPPATKALNAALADGLSRALANFDAATARYDAPTAAERRAELAAELQAEAAPLLREALRAASNACGAAFGAKLLAALPADVVLDDFGGQVAALRREALDGLEAEAGAVCGPPLGAAAPQPEALAELRRSAAAALGGQLDALADAARRKQAEVLTELAKAAGAAALSTALDALLKRPPAALWAKVAELLEAQLGEAALGAAFAAELASLGMADASELRPPLRAHLRAALGARLRAEAAGLRHQLPRAFDRAFRLDAAGLPRAWGARDDVDAACAAAKAQALELLALYRQPEAAALVAADGGGAEARLVDDEEAEALETALAAELAPALQQARAAQQASARSVGAPLWLLALLPVLGFNEGVALLSSPPTLFLLLLLGGGALALHAASPGLPLRVARLAYDEASKHARRALG